MVYLLVLSLIPLAMVLAAAALEAWARHRQWDGFRDDRPVYRPRRRR